MDNIQIQVDLTNIVLALIAGVGLWAAWHQLRTMRQDSQIQIGISKQQELGTRAAVLLSLDERFSSESMQEAISEMTLLIDRINKEADRRWAPLALKERRAKSIELYPEELERMRKDIPSSAYTKLIRICTFFDTVGYVTYSEYVPLEDILRLFGPAIDDASRIFRAHILKLKDDYNEAMYENFLWLINNSKKQLPGVK